MSSSFENICERIANNTNERVVDIMEDFNDINNISKFESQKKSREDSNKEDKKDFLVLWNS